MAPLVELKLAEEGAKFVEREIEILEGDTTPASKPVKKSWGTNGTDYL